MNEFILHVAFCFFLISLQMPCMQGIHSEVVSSRSVHILITIGKYCQEDSNLEIIWKYIFFRILLMCNSKDDQGHKDKYLDTNTKILSQ